MSDFGSSRRLVPGLQIGRSWTVYERHSVYVPGPVKVGIARTKSSFCEQRRGAPRSPESTLKDIEGLAASSTLQ